MIRPILVVIAALILAAAVVRNTAVAAWTPDDPSKAARLWPSHPAVQRAEAMAAVGSSARQGDAADAVTIARFNSIAASEPMAIEPLLVRGIEAQSKGDLVRAERLFKLAEARQGRALAPHYFLADLFLRSGRVEDGLREVANLSRLSEAGVGQGAPYLAEFARAPANWPRMRKVLASQPDLMDPVLDTLAANPDDLKAVLALADSNRLNAEAHWVPIMLNSMIKADRAGEAQALWARMTGNPVGASLHDPDFRDARSPPPFNWELTQSAVGLAERQAGAGLHVIYYGSQGGALVRQLLILGPGDYRLAIESSGRIADPSALNWTLTCGNRGAPLATLPMPAGGNRSWRFSIPAGCSPQWLSLIGREQDMSGQSYILIRRIRIEKVGGNG